MTNQKDHWNKLHGKRTLDDFSTEPTEFAGKVARLFQKTSQILELGCGLGNDAVYFAKLGHNVLATDFSDVIIRKDKQTYKDVSSLRFKLVDSSKPLPFKDQKFDVIYARLSLHYFNEQTTRKVFKEISRILKNGGLLCFICKSVNDPLYGQGEEIEKDTFLFENHIRHFFSEEYTKKLLKENYQVKNLLKGGEDFYGHPSAFIEVIAKKF